MTLGEKLQTLRRSRGLSQEQLAEILEVSRQAVSKWENRAVLVWRGAASAGLFSSADRAYMKAPVPRPTLRLVDKVSRSCGYTPGKVTGQRATVKAEMNGFTPGLDRHPPSR